MFSNLILLCSSQLKPPTFYLFNFWINKLAWDTHDGSCGWSTAILLTICSKIAKAWGYFRNLDNKKMRCENVKNWVLKNVAFCSILKRTLLAFLKMQSLQNRGAKHIMNCVLNKKTCVCSVITGAQTDPDSTTFSKVQTLIYIYIYIYIWQLKVFSIWDISVSFFIPSIIKKKKKTQNFQTCYDNNWIVLIMAWESFYISIS